MSSATTSVIGKPLNPEHIERFSSWDSLLKAVTCLVHMVHSFQSISGIQSSMNLWTLASWLLETHQQCLPQTVTCRRLQRTRESQTMADLPEEHLGISPPFTLVGLDVFGLFLVSACHTWGGHAQSKSWAVLFTCMSTQAVHIEIIDLMDISSCINTLQRFLLFLFLLNSCI